MRLAAIVNTTTLAKAVLYSLVSGVGIVVVFAAGISSAAGLLDALRERRTAASVAWGALAVACIACAAAGIVVGIVVMTQKG
jgi:uncharacterized membrane-anchored protein YitT (DUF2179 family)